MARAGACAQPGPAGGGGRGAAAVRGGGGGPVRRGAGRAPSSAGTTAVGGGEPLREQRAASRGHALTDERAARQLSQEEKARRATFTVRNDGSVEDLERELSAVLGRVGG